MNFYRLALLAAALACVCNGVHVTVREKQQFAMLFQSVVLPCHYQTASTQTPVVQWWYKSYCRDRTRESFSLPESRDVQASERGARSQMDCSDSSRTVRVVASAQGASLTLAEHYKNRDIAIINKADLRIGELQWGDSGVYYCNVVIADDVEGKNEAHLELLVLEWAFVGCVAAGSFLFLVLLGICWCQCCPHSCCCYVRCCCCPETCCCPQHLYEAGKKAKPAPPAPVPVYPYYIPGVPAVMPLTPSSHTDPKVVSAPSVENNLAGVRSGYRLKASQDQDSLKVLYYIEKELAQVPSAKLAALRPSSLSELSSLHEGGNTDFRHTYQTVQMKALPPIADTDDHSMLRAAPPTRSRRQRLRERNNHSDDELDRRWNARSEHLQRQTLSKRGRTGSLDELEEFARSYGSRRRRPEPPDIRDCSPPRRFYRDEDDGWARRSPSPLPQKRRGTWDSELASRPSCPQDYDNVFLNHALASKARGPSGDRGRTDEDSDTPSKGSSRGKGSSYYSRSPSNRPEDEDPLPPYSEREAERYRRAGPTPDWYHSGESGRTEQYDASEPGLRPFSYTRPQQGMTLPLQGGREEADRRRNLSTALSRDSLLV
ncbi:immunoglobulin-like domain-containing receptor 2 isoform X2 [Dunckerocampus dactyliophorus]|uniref:immunoglobulin-like domain-containing receptor 2 isoform X2 n=1 Tax=Dunckerocampus dactyliophorus TaxID=161453 RepID=UPI0024053D45|nr:immunoglobulin-like domain-containing receptor 2 isoform X2 [Dunckerocampus dactyliophorus]